jgi:type IV pilus assembly protein PilE
MKLVANKHSGFTLIELMIVVVIIGVLASIAVPSYTAYVENGRRAEGKAFALDIASRQERHFTQFSVYATTINGGGATSATNLGASDLSENGNYIATITMASGATATYRIDVDPQNADPECEILTLTNTGARDIVGGTGTKADCWR